MITEKEKEISKIQMCIVIARAHQNTNTFRLSKGKLLKVPDNFWRQVELKQRIKLKNLKNSQHE